MYSVKEKNIFLITLILSIILLINISSYWVYINDDAYITFRYSKNMASGIGPVYNEGECVEGYTNFLWMIIFSGAIYTFPSLDISFAGKILGAFCSIITLFFTAYLSFEIRAFKEDINKNVKKHFLNEYLPFISVLLLAANPCFALNSVSGLETALFTMLITAGIYLDVIQIKKRRWSVSSLFFALSALTRPEGFLIALTSYIFKNLNFLQGDKKLFFKSILKEGVIYSLVFIPFLFFKLYFYHDIFPNTFYAKIGGFGSGLFYILKFFYNYGYFLPLALLLLSLFSLKKCRPGYYLAIVLIIYLSGIILWGSDWMEGYRMIVPLLPVIFLLVQEGVVWIYECLKKFGRDENNFLKWQEKTAIFLILFISFFSITRGVESRTRIFTRTYGYYNGHIKLAQWFESNANSNDTIALMDIGIIGYFNTDKNILDITGLTDKHIAESKGNFLHKDYDLKYIFNKKPEYIVLVSKKHLEVSNNRVILKYEDFWSAIEQRISVDENFRKNYILSKVFQHDYPSSTLKYYLNLFVRKDLL